MKQSPCKECTHRGAGCHALCALYMQWKSAADAARETRQAAQAGEWAAAEFTLNTHRRIRRRNRSQK